MRLHITNTSPFKCHPQLIMLAIKPQMESLLEKHGFGPESTSDPTSMTDRAWQLRHNLQAKIRDDKVFLAPETDGHRLLHDRDACELFIAVNTTLHLIREVDDNGYIVWP